jgi:hypothetical protein
MIARLRLAAILLLVIVAKTFAADNILVNYQGVVEIEGGAYTGDGYFEFAISDGGGSSNYWANNRLRTREPRTPVQLSVTNGFFHVALGDPNLMEPLSRSVFVPGTDIWLTVWFSFNETGEFAQLGPTQAILPVPTAVNADLLDGHDYEDVIATSTNAAYSLAVDNFTNLFLLRAGDTCTGQLRISNVVVDTTVELTDGDLFLPAGRRVYLDGRGGGSFVTCSSNGTIAMYKNAAPVFEIE